MVDQVSLTAAELELWRSFYLMRRRLDRALDLQLQRDSDISASEYEIIISLHDAPERRLRIKDIADAVGWEKSRVSHLVTRMEKRGLLERSTCDTDARSSWIGLTPQGRRAALGALRSHLIAIRRYFFDVLGEGDGEVLDRLSGRVIEAIGCGADEDAPTAA